MLEEQGGWIDNLGTSSNLVCCSRAKLSLWFCFDINGIGQKDSSACGSALVTGIGQK